MTGSNDSSTEIAAFAALAEAYCSFIASPSPTIGADVLLMAQDALPRLYSGALRLPNVWNPPPALPDDDRATDDLPDDAQYDPGAAMPDPDATTEAQLRDMTRRIGESISDVRHYNLIFAPYDIDHPDPVVGDLADDLVAVYDDLQRGLARFRRGDLDGAAWEWQFQFAAHWGRHALDAMRAIHALAFDMSVEAGPDRSDG